MAVQVAQFTSRANKLHAAESMHAQFHARPPQRLHLQGFHRRQSPAAKETGPRQQECIEEMLSITCSKLTRSQSTTSAERILLPGRSLYFKAANAMPRDLTTKGALRRRTILDAVFFSRPSGTYGSVRHPLPAINRWAIFNRPSGTNGRRWNFRTCPFGGLQRMHHGIAKNAYGLGAPTRQSALGFVRITAIGDGKNPRVRWRCCKLRPSKN